MASADKKIVEATDNIRQAEKCLKTGFMKWKPDFDGAATEYARAATNFRTAKALAQCKDCHLKAADCFAKNHSFFSAGKSYEQAAMVSKDLEDYDAVVQLVQKACQLFREHGAPDTAALTLEKGAKIIEAKFPEKAVNLYCQAAEIVLLEDRPKQAAEFSSKAARMYIKLRRFDEAMTMLRKELANQVEAEDTASAGRIVIALVLLNLTLEDYVAADKVFREMGTYVSRDEHMALIDLLEGYDQGDPEQCYRALSHPFFKHMDVEYARLCRDLQHGFSQQMAKAKQQMKSSNAQAVNQTSQVSTVLSASGDDEEDEFAGGLL